MTNDNFAQGHFIKIKWLVADVTAINPLTGQNMLFWGVILAGHVFDQFRPYLQTGRHFVRQESPIES